MIKNFSKRLGRKPVLALVALAAIVATGSGCDDILGSAFAGFPFHAAESAAPAPAQPTPTETVTWTDGYEVVVVDYYY